MKHKLALVAAILLCGCEKLTVFPKEPDQHVWKYVGKRTSLGEEWNYICPSTGRMDDAQVTYDEEQKVYKLWSGGANYGEYDTLEHAKAAGERAAANRPKCPPFEGTR